MRKFCSLFIIISLHLNSFAQISNDSLLSLFQTKEKFEVFESLRQLYLDYEMIRKDERLKPYFIECLNLDEYYKRNLKNARKNIESRNLDMDICFNILNKRKIYNRDSILLNPELYKIYRDSTIEILMKKEMHHFKDKIPFGAVWVHSQLKYPESYDFVKKKWFEDGKPISGSLFQALLRLNDAEALEIFDSQVDKFVKEHGKDQLLMEQISRNMRITNSHILTKSLDLLSVSSKKPITANYSEPFGCFVARYLIEVADPDYNLNERDCGTIKKERKRIAKIVKKKAEALKAEEKLWMQDIKYIDSKNIIYFKF